MVQFYVAKYTYLSAGASTAAFEPPRPGSGGA
jgi:hypothetical protein